ncbi:MAG: SAM-dependent methyltransferase [Flavobacteriales bacterium TMED235]|nr:MAG: SAM-dependent methyltransferase [Flavobacteriales bacterium TMED235]|tara:strand:- start:1313 stop:2368 length:1056 start_codon:yes stop_codon:yes gene_type:complete
MKANNSNSLPLDKFIELALYDKNYGYYMKKNPFGKEGDFITAPNITRLFSEIIAIWIITFWKSLGSPKKFNLIELGAGNGEMMRIIIKTLKNFPVCFNSCNFMIHEKSKFLINLQKNNLDYEKIKWIGNLKKINSYPTLYIANEFFDAIPIKQFFKKKQQWFEKFVDLNNFTHAKFREEKTNIKKIEKILKFEVSKNQDIIEYSPKTFEYLNNILSKIEKNNGGILIIDYGYLDFKMQDTLQAIKNHKYSNILKNIGDTDITYNINFSLFKQYTFQFNKVNTLVTDQKKFLTSMGILQRAEIISKKMSFSKKTDLFYRIRRLIDKKHMGELFKVMLIKNKSNTFNTGFQID